MTDLKTLCEKLILRLELSYQKEETEMFRRYSNRYLNPDGWQYHSAEYQRIRDEIHDFRYHLDIVEEDGYYLIKELDKLQVICKVDKENGDLYSVVTGEVVANLLDQESRNDLFNQLHYNKVIR